MEKTVLITGASGFIGSHLAEALAGQGKRVRCLVRRTSDISFLKTIDVELCYGDLLDVESLKSAVKDVAIVYHLAAQVRPHKIISSVYEFVRVYKQVNVDGTINLAQECMREGISKFIYFSSIAAIGVGVGLKENSLCYPVTEYGKTKLEAERYLIKQAEDSDFPVTIIRPGQIYGPRGLGMLTFFKLIRHGIFPIIGDGTNQIPVCYVDDLVKGAIKAAEKGKNANVYFMFEKLYKFEEYLNLITSIVGGRLNRIKVPKTIAFTGVTLKEMLERLVRLKICPFYMDIGKGGIISVSSDWIGSTDKARAELAYMPEINLRKGMECTVEWFQIRGLL